MSNTNNTMQTKTSNALHNAIVEASGKDRPPMLALGNYAQWKSIIKRYIDTKPNNELIYYCLQNPPYKFKWTKKTVPVTEHSSETTTKRMVNHSNHITQEWQMFVTLVKQNQELKTVSYHKRYDIMKQHQNEVNEIRAKRLAQEKKLSTLLHLLMIKKPTMVAEDDEMSKDKAIDKLMLLTSLLFNKIYKPTNNNLITLSNTSRAKQDNSLRINRGTGYDNQRVVNVVGARENVGTQVVQQSGIQFYNCKEYGHVAMEFQKPRWANDAPYHKEKMLLRIGSTLYVHGTDSRDYLRTSKNFRPIFDTKPLQEDNYNVFIHNNEHPAQPEFINGTYLKEQVDNNLTIDSLDMSTNGETVEQDDDDLGRECDLLASLIEKLKCEIDESKNCNKLLESLNKTLVDKLKREIEDFKTKTQV
nr:hypothetical protein [Tanacetum cinerariifolium]